MKRHITFLLLITLFIFAIPQVNAAKTKHDVNLDGVFNISDVTTIQKYIADYSLTSFSETKADMNRDGKININDATFGQKLLADLETDAEQLLKIEVNGNTFYADFEDNSSADALKAKLTEGSVTIEMHDYGNFEKVGCLPFTLPRNDTQITTEAGDVILYQGNQLTIYYDTNSWSFTRVAKIRNADSSLRTLLGDGNATVTLSLE